ncbi:hypothetical protein FHR83_004009 [Actinoplanes campanulatus]|uniref:Uncharacterized protein n=1 Tax=Actinoplanes campanulatus TaxID=113559 RepID=A0A7W5FFB9_9ACTN|nr:hypothetical protein [Actinoplanes campanulatus]MBB3096339.1 hypothetical protein [Actinoplanes campanulatus]GGN18916.1 hypothetical protein GCM10010109_32300 [Actinoplanes campanulatus]GID42597.1 hypothetical protein Aca09nite_91030 [Actinoplanes campanulatus]
MADVRPELGEQGWRFFSGLHRLLLHLAGRVPDEWLNHVRAMLAAGDLAQIPDTVSGAVADLGVPLTTGQVALLRETVGTFFGGREPMRIEQVRISDEIPAPSHRFFPVPADVLATDAARIPPRLDLSGRPGDDLWDLPPALAALDDLADRLTDLEDSSPVSVLRGNEDVLSIARAWRCPPEAGVRVVLVEVAAGAAAWDIMRTVQQALQRHGDSGAQVEVFWTGEDLSPYHRAALAGSALFRRPSHAGGGTGGR